MHCSRSKIPSKNLVRQRCAEGFNFGVKGLMVQLRVIAFINPLTPNGHYSGRTAPLTSRRCILNIYSTNIRAEYFKHAA
jgi:hypothetical protein